MKSLLDMLSLKGSWPTQAEGEKINNEYKRLNNIVCLKVMVLWGDMELGKKPGPFGWVVWAISGA